MSEEKEPRLERALGALGRFVSRHASAVVIVLLLSLIPAGWLSMRLAVSASFLDLLPDDELPVRQLDQVLHHARGASDVVIAISTEDRELAERFGRAMIAELQRDQGIQGIGGHVDTEWFRQRQLLFVPERELEDLIARAEEAIDRETMRRSGFDLGLDDEEEDDEGTSELLAEVDRGEERLGRREWVETRDGRYLAVWAFFSGNTGDLEFGRQAWARVRAVADRLRDGERFPRDLEVRYAGGIPSRVEDERALVSDLQIAGAVGFLGVILLIVAALRAPRAIILLAVPLFTGLLWTFAFARLAVGHLNIISGFLFSILSGLGIEYGIHLLHRYRELREEGLPLDRAIEKLVSTTGRALLSGSMTNAGVFAVIAAAQFRGFSEFGLIASVGLLLTLVATLLGMPALLVIGERVAPMKMRAAPDDAKPPLRVPAALRWIVVIAIPIAAIAGATLIARGDVRFDGNWRLLAGDSDATRFGEYLRHQLSGRFNAAVLWVPDDADLPRVEEVIDSVREARTARGEPFDVVEVATLADVFPSPEAQARRAALAQDLGAQLRRIRPAMLDDAGRARLEEGLALVESARPFSLDEMPYSVVGHLLTSDGRGSIVHVRAAETDDADTGVLVAWAAQAREIAAAFVGAGVDAPMLSENWIAGEIFERIAHDGRFLVIGTVLAVFVVLLLDFRRPFAAAAVLSSVLLGVVAMAVGLWLAGVQLNFMNAAILPVCVSISLDNAIHVYHRWREGGPGSIPIVLRHTTMANLLASATNLLGFAALVLTHHAGLRSVAYLAIIGVTSTYLSTTVWFPMVLATIDAWSAKTKRG
ncbi:efflux RND transporter permease subunit [Sandaracinus amylolyticus]|uniref:efflux RND transporter permease subunit n=1 Tax=Sandaracinus amylolyticus TaxID=927083 RepID=UPI001F2B48C4|nr:MMPL family transporter [Sandaracinus amylolyticus]UJR87009.1 Hypothetical protein I5071_91100 [Sandaracinus amylolyticus]